MKYTLKGNLLGANCDDHFMPVSNTIVRLYRYRGNANEATAMTAAQAKETFQLLDEKAINDKAKYLLAETKTDKSGNYAFTIDGDKLKYQGEVVEFDINFSKIPDFGQKDTKASRKFKPFQATLNVLQPKWKETNSGLESQWNYRISHKLWCYILSLLDIWVICGVLLNCESQQPLAGIDVTAMDDDVISDDTLGTATTDSNGRFCIYYRSKDFKKTFLSPIGVNLETPLFPWGNGPDIYFKYAFGGSSLGQDEDPSRARKPDRENVSNCFCVSLCLKVGRGTDDGEPVAAFFDIGLLRRYHSILNIDPTTGKTTGKVESSWNDSAFFGTMALLGTLTKKLNSNPMEYLFQYTELSNPTDAIPVADSAWHDVLESWIDNTEIGYSSEYVAPPPFPYYIIKKYAIHANSSQIPVLFNGNWIVVPQDAKFIPNVNGALIRLKTDMLPLKSPVLVPDMHGLEPTGLRAGGSTIAPPLSTAFQKNRYFSLRMKKREAGNPGSEVVAGFSRALAIFNTVYHNVPKGGSWAPYKVSTQNGVASLDLQELSMGNGCSKITNALNAKFTAANPNLGGVSITMSGPGLPPPPHYAFGSVSHSTPGQEAHGSLPYVGTVSALSPCAYIVKLQVNLKMTNGESQHVDLYDEVAFCK